MADITTSRVFTDGEKGITATKLNDIIGSSTIQPAFVSAKPVSGTAVAGDNLLLLKAAGTYAQVDASAFATSMVPLLPDPNPNIWSQRLRSFNSIGNPNFEVDQRTAGTGVVVPAGNIISSPLDRWQIAKVGTMAVTGQQLGTANVVVPGTSFRISSIVRIVLTTAQASLGAGDYLMLQQQIEGPYFRELSLDVHSVSILVRSSVANLKFGMTLRDAPTTKALGKVCALGAANTWTLIQFPNLPVWPAANFVTAPGSLGYVLDLTLAAGTTFIFPAADTWQTGVYYGPPGIDNFASKATSSSIDFAVVQHEPGPLCSTLMDCPFIQNYDECLRYYQKSYDYAVKPGTVSANGKQIGFGPTGWQQQFISVSYPQRLAKNVQPVAYSPGTGAINNIRRQILAADVGCTAFGAYGETGFSAPTAATSTGANDIAEMHYTVDTGW